MARDVIRASFLIDSHATYRHIHHSTAVSVLLGNGAPTKPTRGILLTASPTFRRCSGDASAPLCYTPVASLERKCFNGRRTTLRFGPYASPSQFPEDHSVRHHSIRIVGILQNLKIMKFDSWMTRMTPLFIRRYPCCQLSAATGQATMVRALVLGILTRHLTVPPSHTVVA